MSLLLSSGSVLARKSQHLVSKLIVHHENRDNERMVEIILITFSHYIIFNDCFSSIYIIHRQLILILDFYLQRLTNDNHKFARVISYFIHFFYSLPSLKLCRLFQVREISTFLSVTAQQSLMQMPFQTHIKSLIMNLTLSLSVLVSLIDELLENMKNVLTHNFHTFPCFFLLPLC